MFVIKGKSLTGGTIVEVVTGMFLISLGMALSIVVFSKTMDNANLYVKHKAVNAVDELIVEQTKAMNFKPRETDAGDILITSSSAPFAGNDSLLIVTWTASLKSSGKQLYTRKQVKRVGQ